MAATPLRAAFLLVALAVAGCSRMDIWPMLTGEPKREPKPAAASDQQQTARTQNAAVSMAPLPASSSSYPASTGTFVGQKVDQLRGDLQRLQAQITDHTAQ
jgi:hypothetical protein